MASPLGRPQVDGHVYCKDCPALVPSYIAYQTSHRCFECFLATPAVRRIREVEAQSGMQRLRVDAPRAPGSPTDAKLAKLAARPHSEETKRRARVGGGASLRARRRLARIYPETYRLLHNEERVKIGLPVLVWPVRNALTNAARTFQPEESYDAADSGRLERGPTSAN